MREPRSVLTRMRVPPLLRACRPLHAAKNLLVLVPLVAHHSDDRLKWFHGALAVIAFALAAAGGYLLNDLRDAAHDRLHPHKRHRPVAAGTLSSRTTLAAAGFLIGAAVMLGARLAMPFILFLLGYCVLSFAYSALLRRIAGLDLLAITGFFLLRVMAGGAATGIWLSPWLLTFVGTLALAVACAKRHAELARLDVENPAADDTQAPGRGWWTRHRLLLLGIMICASLGALGVLAAYARSEAAQTLHAHPSRLLLLPVALAPWLMRLFHLTRQGKMQEDPLVFALHDWAAWLTLVAGASVVLWSTR